MDCGSETVVALFVTFTAITAFGLIIALIFGVKKTLKSKLEKEELKRSIDDLDKTCQKLRMENHQTTCTYLALLDKYGSTQELIRMQEDRLRQLDKIRQDEEAKWKKKEASADKLLAQNRALTLQTSKLKLPLVQNILAVHETMTNVEQALTSTDVKTMKELKLHEQSESKQYLQSRREEMLKGLGHIKVQLEAEIAIIIEEALCRLREHWESFAQDADWLDEEQSSTSTESESSHYVISNVHGDSFC